MLGIGAFARAWSGNNMSKFRVLIVFSLIGVTFLFIIQNMEKDILFIGKLTEPK
jgi:hypothetical protein